MSRNCYTIEKLFDDGTQLKVIYSECVKEGNIKILRKGKPNLKWKFEQRIKAEIDLEFIKKFVYEMLFKDDFDEKELLDFMNQNLSEVNNGR